MGHLGQSVSPSFAVTLRAMMVAWCDSPLGVKALCKALVTPSQDAFWKVLFYPLQGGREGPSMLINPRADFISKATKRIQLAQRTSLALTREERVSCRWPRLLCVSDTAEPRLPRFASPLWGECLGVGLQDCLHPDPAGLCEGCAELSSLLHRG